MVSVVIPVYNREKYLPECIRSVKAQTSQDWECILVDDGSADGSGALCDAAAASDGRFRVVHQKNKGVAVARNAGLALAQGQYIAFVDSDDVLPPEYLSALLAAREAAPAPCEIVLCSVVQEKPDGTTHLLCSAGGYRTAEQYVRQVLLQQINYIQMCVPFGKLYDRAFLQSNGLQMEPGRSRGEDLLFNLACLQYCTGVMVTEAAAYRYCPREDSLTASYRPEVLEAEARELEGLQRLADQYGLNGADEQGALRLLRYRNLSYLLRLLPQAQRGKTLRKSLRQLLDDQLLTGRQLMQLKGGGKRWALLAYILDKRSVALLQLWLAFSADRL